MNKDQVKYLIQEALKEDRDERLLVLFECPSCKRETVAVKMQYVSPSELNAVTSPYGVILDHQGNWDDRRCLICGGVFKWTNIRKYVKAKEGKCLDLKFFLMRTLPRQRRRGG